VLDAAPAANVVFAGDMNWSESRDGGIPLKVGRGLGLGLGVGVWGWGWGLWVDGYEVRL